MPRVRMCLLKGTFRVCFGSGSCCANSLFYGDLGRWARPLPFIMPQAATQMGGNMSARALWAVMGGMVLMATVLVTPADAQLSGRVVLREGPIAVDVVFGPQYGTTRQDQRVIRREAPAPARYREGMSLFELERYLERIEYEYDTYRRMDSRDAYYYLGWTRDQLRDYVHFLRDERGRLRAEKRRVERLVRAEQRRFERPGRGRGRGRGRGLAVGLARGW